MQHHIGKKKQNKQGSSTRGRLKKKKLADAAFELKSGSESSGTSSDMMQDDGGEMADEGETLAWEKLDSHLRKCAKCGPKVRCKLTARLDHKVVPVQHISLWARRMVCSAFLNCAQ